MRRNDRMLQKYRIETRREKLERLTLPLVCKVLGHPEQLKMYDVICKRCRTVLRRRGMWD
jgi:hypothetical protein